MYAHSSVKPMILCNVISRRRTPSRSGSRAEMVLTPPIYPNKRQTENESEASLALHHGLPTRSSRWYSRCWCCLVRCPYRSGCRWIHRGRNHRWVMGCRHDVSSCRSERRGGGSGHHSGRVAGSRCGWSGGSGYGCNCWWRSSSCTGSKRGSKISCNLIDMLPSCQADF